MYVRNVPLKKLWELDIIGIFNSIQSFNRKGNFDLSNFKDKMKILSDGRYEVEF